MANRSAFNQPINLIGPEVTTSAISGGPPTSPSDGDLWMASSVDANGARWQFQYNAGSASTLKWEFIGGSPLQIVRGSTDSYTSNSTVIADTNLGTITIPRTGEYFLSYTVWISALPTVVQGDVMKNGAASGNWSATASQGMLVMNPTALACSGGDTIGMGFFCGSASSFSAAPRSLTILPRRIS